MWRVQTDDWHYAARRANFIYAGDDPAMTIQLGCCGAHAYPHLSTPSVTDEGMEQSISTPLNVPLTVGSGANRAVYGSALYYGTSPGSLAATWYPAWIDAGNKGSGQALTLLDSATHLVDAGASDARVAFFRLLAPNASTQAGSVVEFAVPDGEVQHTAAWSLTGVHQTTPEYGTAATTGTGTSSSVAVTSGSGALVLDHGGWVKGNATVVAPTPTAGQTVTGTETTDKSFGLGDMGSGAGRGTNATPTWDFGAAGSAAWLAAAVAVRGG